MSFILTITAVLTVATASTESVQISNNTIWGLNLPGTKDIKELESVPKGLPEKEFLRRSALLRMTRKLNHSGYGKSDKPPVGFVVEGLGKEALAKASDVITGKTKRSEVFPTGKDLTLVFFTNASGRYVRLDEVVRRGNDIDIKYHFVTKNTMDAEVYVALIPLGKLPANKYPVWVKRNPPVYGRGAANRPTSPAIVKKTISGSFTFIVSEKKKE